MDSNAVFAVLLLIVGLGILCAEVFVPSGGLLGVITFLCLVVSLIFAYRAWGTSHPGVFAVFCVMLLLLVPTVIGFGFYLLPRTSMGKKVLLEAPESKDVTPFEKDALRLKKLVGQFGTTLSMLNPGGLVSVRGERLHAVSDGLGIDSGESVEIVEVNGTRIVVRPGTPPVQNTDAAGNHREFEQSPENSTKLDFEFPTA